MRQKFILFAAISIAFYSCSTYNAPTYVEPANPADTIELNKDNAGHLAYIIYLENGVGHGGDPLTSKILEAKKVKAGTNTKLDLKMQFLRYGQPHTVTLTIPDYQGVGKYGKDQKNEFADITMQIIKNTAPDSTWFGDRNGLELTVVRDNAKYIEIDFAGAFDIFRPSVSGSAGTQGLYNGKWYMRWEL
jgi:hypothetical protein